MIEILKVSHSKVDSKIVGVRHQLNRPVVYNINYRDSSAQKSEVLVYSFSVQRGEIRRGYRFSASIPWGFHWLIGDPLDEKFRIPSLLHDDMCDKGVNGVLRDKAFRFLLKEEGVDSWKVRLMFKAVVKYREVKAKVKGWF